MPEIYLIDGNAYIHRAYHALPPLSTSRGEMVNAVYGFIRMLLKIMRTEKPEYLAVCFDYPAATFRHKAYAGYKAHRKAIDDELKTQMPLAREAVRAMNIPLLEKQGYEADDLIATMARRAEKDGATAVIVTGDKDALQLVNGRITVFNESKNLKLGPAEVLDRYGLEPGQLIDMFALMGDASDNVPGVKGIGDKTAVKLIQRFGSLNAMLERLGEVEERWRKLIDAQRDMLMQSRELVTLCDQVPLDLEWHDCRLGQPDREKLVPFMQRMEFTSLLGEILPTAGEQAPAAAVSPAAIRNIPVAEITGLEELEGLVRKLEAAGSCSVDLETTGRDPFSSDIVGIAFATGGSSAWYVPVGHNTLSAQIDRSRALETLKPVFTSDVIKKYGHNIKYDMQVLGRYGIELRGIYFDTMIASYCLNPSRQTHGLKALALELLTWQMTGISELIGTGKKQITMVDVDPEKAARYAGADAAAVMLLAEIFSREIAAKKLEKLFFDIEMPLVSVLARMELHGLHADTSYLRALGTEFAGKLKQLESDIFAAAGQEFNPNSTRQLGTILFEKLKLPVVRRTKTGYSTDEEVLRTLAPQHPLPGRLIDYRELQKLKSTYIDALLERCDPASGRVHASFNQTVAATGRLSSSDPNLQNIPIRSEYGKMIRRAFVAEPGGILVSGDYSQIDLRVLAHMSGDPVLAEAFKRGEDIHAATAREIFPGPVTPETRRAAKSINFGIVYGISAFGLSQQLGIAPSEAKDYIDRYFARYSGVREWIDRTIREARANGFVSTLLGRIRYLPEINAKNGQIRGFAERMAMNTPIQGTSADIIKIAMLTLDRMLREGGFAARMLVQVHDDLLFEVPENEADMIVPVVRTAMEQAVPLNVPVTVDMKSGANWADMK